MYQSGFLGCDPLKPCVWRHWPAGNRCHETARQELVLLANPMASLKQHEYIYKPIPGEHQGRVGLQTGTKKSMSQFMQEGECTQVSRWPARPACSAHQLPCQPPQPTTSLKFTESSRLEKTSLKHYQLGREIPLGTLTLCQGMVWHCLEGGRDNVRICTAPQSSVGSGGHLECPNSNACSVRNKQDKLEASVLSQSCDTMGISETYRKH